MLPIYTVGMGEGDAAIARLKWWFEHPPATVVLDVETISLDERKPLGFGLAFSPHEALYCQLHPVPYIPILELVAKLINDITITKVAHNWLFDMAVFPLIPVVGNKLDRYNIWDTNVAARLLGYLEVSLDILAGEVNKEVTSARELLKGGKTFLDVEPQVVIDHCLNDVLATYALYLKFKPKIDEQYGEYFKTEMAVIPILVDLSNQGISLDQDMRQELEEKYIKDVEFYRQLCVDQEIEKPGSPQQVGQILAKRGNFLPFTRKKVQLSTRIEELEFLDDPLAAAIIGYRQKSKFLSTYLKPLAGSDRFYTEYYMETSVGRLNSRNRNIQNIPPDARCMFVPDRGVFTEGDYAQEHLYILAHLSKDPVMKSIYEEGLFKGDIHDYVADQLGILRRLAKTVNYAIIYGATAKTISEQTKIKDLYRCSRLLNDWFGTFRVAAGYLLELQQEGLRSGWAAPTLFGRRIRIPEENIERMKSKAVNYPILGSDGEVIKRAILLCNRRGLGPPQMVMTVHDSLLWDGAVEPPVEELEMIPGFRIPFEVKTKLRWG